MISVTVRFVFHVLTFIPMKKYKHQPFSYVLKITGFYQYVFLKLYNDYSVRQVFGTLLKHNKFILIIIYTVLYYFLIYDLK